MCQTTMVMPRMESQAGELGRKSGVIRHGFKLTQNVGRVFFKKFVIRTVQRNMVLKGRRIVQ